MTFRHFVALLRAEYRSRHEGSVPPIRVLLWEPWVASYLRALAPGQKGVR